VVLFAAAILGNACGYAIGAKAGPRIFQRDNSRLFKEKYVEKTREFFDKYGNRAIVLARFVPIVRTFITVMAGVAGMGFRRFLFYSAVGGLLWASGVTVLGYYLGQIELVRNNIEAMLLAIVLISVIPVGVELLRARASEKAAARHAQHAHRVRD
jgi:membrane-associated protein